MGIQMKRKEITMTFMIISLKTLFGLHLQKKYKKKSCSCFHSSCHIYNSILLLVCNAFSMLMLWPVIGCLLNSILCLFVDSVLCLLVRYSVRLSVFSILLLWPVIGGMSCYMLYYVFQLSCL